jgi:hypothetical protein
MGEFFAHGYDFGDHPVRVAEQLGCVNQDRIVFPIDEGRVAVEPQIAVQKDSEF